MQKVRHKYRILLAALLLLLNVACRESVMVFEVKAENDRMVKRITPGDHLRNWAAMGGVLPKKNEKVRVTLVADTAKASVFADALLLIRSGD